MHLNKLHTVNKEEQLPCWETSEEGVIRGPLEGHQGGSRKAWYLGLMFELSLENGRVRNKEQHLGQRGL